VSLEQPTTDQARAAIAKAEAARVSVRSADRYFGFALLAWSGCFLAAMAIVAALHLNAVFVFLMTIPVAIATRALGSWQRREQRAFTTFGKIAFYSTIGIFLLWTAILISWGLTTGWLGPRASERSFALMVVAVVPVPVGALVLLWRK
jgi:hypothetical protein